MITSVTHSIDVADLDAAKEWYSALLGSSPTIEPIEGVLEWQLFAGVWLQISESESVTTGSQMLRLGTDQIAATTERLADVGIQVGEVERIEGVIAFCEFTDPFGNHLSIYQVL